MIDWPTDRTSPFWQRFKCRVLLFALVFQSWDGTAVFSMRYIRDKNFLMTPREQILVSCKSTNAVWPLGKEMEDVFMHGTSQVKPCDSMTNVSPSHCFCPTVNMQSSKDLITRQKYYMPRSIWRHRQDPLGRTRETKAQYAVDIAYKRCHSEEIRFPVQNNYWLDALLGGSLCSSV